MAWRPKYPITRFGLDSIILEINSVANLGLAIVSYANSTFVLVLRCAEDYAAGQQSDVSPPRSFSLFDTRFRWLLVLFLCFWSSDGSPSP